MPTLSYYWQVEDAMLGFFGGVCMLFFYTIYGTAPVAWVIYLGEWAEGKGKDKRRQAQTLYTILKITDQRFTP